MDDMGGSPKSSIILSTGLVALTACSSHQEQGGMRKAVDPSWIDIGSIQMDGRSYDVVHASDTLFILFQDAVVFKHEAFTSSIELIDFDEDGLQDIMLHYNTNVPDIRDLIRYSSEARSFRMVEAFSRFPAPTKIPGCVCYYSYHRSGCADLNWDSDLFIIENSSAIRLGNINGNGCDYDNPDPMIRVSMIGIDEEPLLPLIDSLPIDSAWSYAGLKWEFIEKYWNREHPRFIQARIGQ